MNPDFEASSPELSVFPDRQTKAHRPYTALLLVIGLERFSYYSIRTLLFFFISSHLRLDDMKATSSLDLLAGLTTLLPLAGGFIADRVFGVRKTVFAGCTVMLFSFFCFAVSVASPAVSEELLLLGIIALAAGDGLMRPALLVWIADRSLQERKDGRFAMAHFVVAFGGALAAAVSFIYDSMGTIAFVVPYLAVTIALFTSWKRKLQDERQQELLQSSQDRKLRPGIQIRARRLKAIIALAVLIPAGLWFLGADAWMFVTADLVICFPLVILSDKMLSRQQISSFGAIVFIVLLTSLFWMCYRQNYAGIQQMAGPREGNPARAPFSMTMTIAGFSIFILGPILALCWFQRGKKETIYASIMKIAFGLLLALAVSLAVFFFTSQFSAGSVPPILIVCLVIILTLAELVIAPLIMSVVAKIGPRAWMASIFGFLSAVSGLLTLIVSDKLNSFDTFVGALLERPFVPSVLMLAVLTLFVLLLPWLRKRFKKDGLSEMEE